MGAKVIHGFFHPQRRELLAIFPNPNQNASPPLNLTELRYAYSYFTTTLGGSEEAFLGALAEAAAFANYNWSSIAALIEIELAKEKRRILNLEKLTDRFQTGFKRLLEAQLSQMQVLIDEGILTQSDIEIFLQMAFESQSVLIKEAQIKFNLPPDDLSKTTF